MKRDWSWLLRYHASNQREGKRTAPRSSIDYAPILKRANEKGCDEISERLRGKKLPKFTLIRF